MGRRDRGQYETRNWMEAAGFLGYKQGHVTAADPGAREGIKDRTKLLRTDGSTRTRSVGQGDRVLLTTRLD